MQTSKKNKLTSIKTVQHLSEAGFISPEKIADLQKVAQQFSISITPEISELLSSSNHEDPLNLQFIPSAKELELHPDELNDPVGDHVHSAVPGIVHRYPDRCLLKVINVCPVYCRFCFRREQIGHQGKMLNESELKIAYDYIASNPEIWEVILTGGDPLMLTPKKLADILQALENIPHVEVIRIHTRIPVVDTKRITPSMLKALNIKKALFIILHANHPQEFTPQSTQAIKGIIAAGIPMLSQSVLLKGINDNVETMKALLKTFVKHRIKPYYLHHMDLAKGTSHFRTSLEVGKTLMRELRGNISGLCQPTYILDIPGGHGKVPVDSQFVTSFDAEQYDLEDFKGKKHRYPPSSK